MLSRDASLHPSSTASTTTTMVDEGIDGSLESGQYTSHYGNGGDDGDNNNSKKPFSVPFCWCWASLFKTKTSR
jgi:hypothetical protein